MKKYIIVLLAITALITGEAYADEAKKTCVRGYGKTAAEAFSLGVKLAESKDAELGKKHHLRADTRIRVLPEKVNGLYVVEVYSSRKGACDLKLEGAIADTVVEP
jgi:hypothetical protein